MKKILIIIVIIIFCTGIAYSDQPNIQFYEQLNERMYEHLDYLSSTARNRRMIGGALTTGIGFLFSGLGLIVGLADSSSEEQRAVGYSMAIGSAVIGITGITALVFPSEEEKLYSEYVDYPDENGEQLIKKVNKFENEFRLHADKRRRGRIIGGSIGLATGFGSQLYLRTSHWFYELDKDIYDTVNYFSYAYSIALIGVGLGGLLMESDVESEWDAYLLYKDDLN